MKIYTGVGSRDLPEGMADILQQVAFKLAQEGWRLRSGAADGADIAFEIGCDDAGGEKEIYLPWSGFNDRTNAESGVYVLLEGAESGARKMAWDIHPAPDRLSRGALALHARNCYQVLGLDLTYPSNMLICWAKTDKMGDAQGGTRTAWMLAKKHNIPAYNLNIPAHYERIRKWLNIL